MENLKFIPYNEEQRFDQIKENIPLFFTLKTLLYIGVNEKHFQFKGYLHNHKITLLEVYKPNLEFYTNKYECINADITKFETEDKWDVIMWWHGPEHITKKELKPTLQKLESMTKKLVILGCPWGEYKQGAVDGNIYEIHRNYIYPEDLIELGYSTKTIGKPDYFGNNLMGWRML